MYLSRLHQSMLRKCQRSLLYGLQRAITSDAFPLGYRIRSLLRASADPPLSALLDILRQSLKQPDEAMSCLRSLNLDTENTHLSRMFQHVRSKQPKLALEYLYNSYEHSKEAVGCANFFINLFALVGNLEMAELVFDRLESPRIIDYETMLQVYLMKRENEKAKNIEYALRKNPFHAEPRISLIKRLANEKKALEANAKKHQFYLSEHYFSRKGKIDQVCHEMTCSKNEPVRAEEPSFDIYVISSLMNYYLQHRLEHKAESIFRMCVSLKFPLDECCHLLMMKALVNTASIDKVFEFFHSCPTKGTQLCNLLLSCCAKRGYFNRFAEVLKYMETSNVRRSYSTYSIIIDFFVRTNRISEAFEAIDSMRTDGYSLLERNYNLLLAYFLKHKNLNAFWRIYNEMPMELRDYRSETMKLTALQEENADSVLESARQAVQQVTHRDLLSVIPDLEHCFDEFDKKEALIDTKGKYSIFFAKVVEIFVLKGRFEEAKGLLMHIGNEYTFKTLLQVYLRLGDLRAVVALLEDESFTRDSFVYNRALHYVCKTDNRELAEYLVSKMINENIELDDMSYTSLVFLYSRLGNQAKVIEVLEQLKAKPHLLESAFFGFFQSKRYQMCVKLYHMYKGAAKSLSPQIQSIIIGCYFRLDLPPDDDLLNLAVSQDPLCVDTCNMLLFFFSRNKERELIMALLRKMGQGGVSPTQTTWSLMIQFEVKEGNIDTALMLYERSLHYYASPPATTFATLIDGLFSLVDRRDSPRLGRILLLVSEMRNKCPAIPSFVYDMLISNFRRLGMDENACDAYSWMIEDSIADTPSSNLIESHQ